MNKLPRLTSEQYKILYHFCYDLLASLEEGVSGWHHACNGLCGNIEAWGETFDQTSLDLYTIWSNLTPFNDSYSDYSNESDQGAIFQNPKRLAFIKRHAKKHTP